MNPERPMKALRSMRRLRAALLVPVVALGLTACDDDDDDGMTPDIPGTLAQEIAGDNRMQTLEEALEAAGLTATLEGDGPFTVLAPVNQGFGALPSMDNLLDPDNEALLREVLQYHLISGEVMSSGLSDGQEVTTLQGTTLTVGVDGGTVTFTDAAGNESTVLEADIDATNGVIHIVGTVLIPELDILETAIVNAFDTLVELVETAGLKETLQSDNDGNGWTVFAPTDDAFGDLAVVPEGDDLTDVLTYHVVPTTALSGDLSDGQEITTVQGETLTVGIDAESGAVTLTDANGNSVSVDPVDVGATNGVIHVVDGVVLPALDVMSIAWFYGYATLAELVDDAGLTATLQGDNGGAGWTVFAPSDDAFDALAAVPEGDLLAEILTYHVIPSTAFSGDLSDGQTLTTVQGEELAVGIDAESGDVSLTDVNGTTVNVGPVDIGAANGVLHEIDGVVLPTLDLLETATVNGFGTLVELVDVAGLTATLQGDNDGEGWTVFAPTDEAFADLSTTPEGDLLADILTYHVVPGTVLSEGLSDGQELATVNGDVLTVGIDADEVTLTDATGSVFVLNPLNVEASNGVIHVVDGVLTPGLDIIETATLAGFSTLVGLVEDAGLTATLQSDNGGEGWTVFAPTNVAFEALPAVPEGAALEAVLLYHVLSGTVVSGDLSDGDVVTTENGDTFTVAINEVTGAVTITDANGGTVNVTPLDVPATNGVIHVIDGVLLPAT